MFGLASALTAGPATHWTSGELSVQCSLARPAMPCLAQVAILDTANPLLLTLPGYAACICQLSHIVLTLPKSFTPCPGRLQLP